MAADNFTANDPPAHPPPMPPGMTTSFLPMEPARPPPMPTSMATSLLSTEPARPPRIIIPNDNNNFEGLFANVPPMIRSPLARLPDDVLSILDPLATTAAAANNQANQANQANQRTNQPDHQAWGEAMTRLWGRATTPRANPMPQWFLDDMERMREQAEQREREQEEWERRRREEAENPIFPALPPTPERVREQEEWERRMREEERIPRITRRMVETEIWPPDVGTVVPDFGPNPDERAGPAEPAAPAGEVDPFEVFIAETIRTQTERSQRTTTTSRDPDTPDGDSLHPSDSLHLSVPDDVVSAIHTAVSFGDVAFLNGVIQTCQAAGIEPEVLLRVEDSWGRTPLLAATHMGSAAAAALLLYYGADTRVKGRFGGTSLASCFDVSKSQFASAQSNFSASNASLDILLVLLSHKSVTETVHEPDVLGRGALAAAVQTGDVNLVATLLDFGVVIPSDYDGGPEVLSPGVRSVLDAASFDVDCAYLRPATANTANLCESLLADNIARARVELEAGAAVNVMTSSGSPLIVECAYNSSAKGVALLLLYGADPTLKSNETATSAVAAAAAVGSVATLHVLLSHKETHAPFVDNPTYMYDVDGVSVAHHAVMSGSVGVVSTLLSYATFVGMFIEPQNVPFASGLLAPVELAASMGESEIVIEIETAARPTLPTFDSLASLVVPETIECSVCLTIPPPPERHAYTCDACTFVYCPQCFELLATTHVNSGEYPVCAGRGCDVSIPPAKFTPFLAKSQVLALLALRVNSEHEIDAVFRQECPACSRVNALDSRAHSNTHAYSCTHCGVRLCAVCSLVYPNTPEDDQLHRECAESFPSLFRFFEFRSLLMDVGQRKCPTCDRVGVKDDACTHMSCCSSYWCYVCGQAENTLPTTVGEHGVNSDEWIANPTKCPMYGYTLARVDARILAAGCNNCVASGTACGRADCIRNIDRRAFAVLATMRTCACILAFANEVGRELFYTMLDRFNYFDIINNNFFEGRLDPTCTDAQGWLEFVPDDVKTFYGSRAHWFITPQAPTRTPLESWFAM